MWVSRKEMSELENRLSRLEERIRHAEYKAHDNAMYCSVPKCREFSASGYYSVSVKDAISALMSHCGVFFEYRPGALESVTAVKRIEESTAPK